MWLKPLFSAVFVCFITITSAQISVEKGGLYAKEYSKEMALYKAKTYAIKEILSQSSEVIKFEINALAAANSGELTTLVYRCESKNKEGLILGFYGDRWNDAGVTFSLYNFKNFPLNEANEFINKIERVYDSARIFLESNIDNNIYFTYNDMTILIYHAWGGAKLRIYWKGFDSEWEWTTFKKTKNRFFKKLK